MKKTKKAKKRKKGVSKREPLLIPALLFTCVCIILVLSAIPIPMAGPVPEPFRIAHGAPGGAVIIQRSEMKPGTFLLYNKSVEEILEEAQASPEKLTIAWSFDGLEYWWPREGTDMHYYSKKVPEINWKYGFLTAEVGLSGKHLVFYPKKNKGLFVTLILFSCLMGGFSLHFWFYKK